MPSDYEGEAGSWEQLLEYLHSLAAAQRTVHVHLGDEAPGRPYARLEGELHHVASDPAGDEWFVVGDSAPAPGDLSGPWSYVRLPKSRYVGASLETIDDDDLFAIVMRFGDEIIRVTHAL